MTLPWSFRQWIALALRSAGIEKLPPREAGWPDHFDNCEGIGAVKRTLFYKHKSGVMLPFKGRPRPVDVAQKIGVEAHITAVAFGTTARARRFWATQIRDEVVTDWRRFAVGAPGNGGEIEHAARRMALHQRFWRVPYHFVALLNGDVLYNNQITRHTYHGNGGNGALVGVSLEGNYPGLERNRKAKHNGYDAHTIETGRAALRLAVEHSRKAGAPIEKLYAHRQYSKNRRGDPGEGWWKEIGIPVSETLGLERVVRYAHGTGRPIPRQWDALAEDNY